MSDKLDQDVLEEVVSKIVGEESPALVQLVSDLLEMEKQRLHQMRPVGLLKNLVAEIDAHLEE